LLKDNENIPLSILTTDEPAESRPAPFTPDQMVRCDECLRANPPTRINCLYCAAVLPQTATTLDLQKPALRPLEKWEQGYNNIVLPPVANLTDANVVEASDLLRLRPEELDRILSLGTPLPLARAATIDEARLIQRLLKKLGINSSIMPDGETGIDSTGVIKIRAIEIDDEGIYAYQNPEAAAIQIFWADFALILTGRLIIKRVEVQEQKAAGSENNILDASEFVSDETVVDFYTRQPALPYRLAANNFDFSCLGPNKALLAGENMSRLVRLFRERAPQADYDDSFNSLRKILNLVWPSDQRNASTGWRRERPGKYSLGSVTELNNEMQFRRYSLLRRHFQSAPENSTPELPGDNG
jgi:hypothetical protein